MALQEQAQKAKLDEKARNLAANHRAQNAFGQIEDKDPDKAEKIKNIWLRWGAETGKLSPGMIPSSFPGGTGKIPYMGKSIDVSTHSIGDFLPSGPPSSKRDLTSPQFKGALQDALKGAGVTPAPVSTATPVPSGGAWLKPPQLVTSGNGQSKYIPSVPNGKPIATNTMPRTVEKPATIPRLSAGQFKLLSPEDQSNYVNSISGATTNRLNNATSPGGLKTSPGVPKEINSKEEWDALPDGAKYIGPDKLIYTKGK
jgi:hypothetical protein